jgi:predicted peptidase
MSQLMDCRKISRLAGHQAFRGGREFGGACLTCLLALVVLCWVVSVAVADDGMSPAFVGDASPFERVKDLLFGKSDDSTVPARDDLKPTAEKIGNVDGLVEEIEGPEKYQKIVAESAYAPTDSPEKLTEGQLDAIAKLAPKANQSGLQSHPAMIPLFRNMILNYTGGTYKNTPIRFRLHTPEPCQEDKKYPMVVWLHGAGECGSDNIDQLSHLHHIIPYLVGPKKRDFFLLVPQCPHSHVAWEAPEICSTKIRADGSVECHVTEDPVALGDAPIAFTIAMIEAVTKQFPIDPNRVAIAGLSTGGEGVWRILERRPDLFAAAAPIVSWQAMHEKSLREKPLLKKIPIWAIYSSDDRGIDFARKEFKRMRDLDCRVYKTEFGVCGHRAWTPAMLQGDVFGWLISRAKDGDRFHAAEPSPTDPTKIGIFADVTDGELKREPTKAVKPKRAGQSDQHLTFTPVMPEAKEAVDPVREEYGRIAREYEKVVREYEKAIREYARTVQGRGEKEAVLEPSAQAPRRPFGGPFGGPPNVATIDQLRLQLMARYIDAGEPKKAIAVANKIKNRQQLVEVLLQVRSGRFQREILDYAEQELDRMEQRVAMPAAAQTYRALVGDATIREGNQSPRAKAEPLRPIPAGKKTPMDECGKEWAMSPTTLYGLFPNGWDQEANNVPGYVINETGKQLRDRLAKAFEENDLDAMKALCESFIRLDDIPLSSPWFDTSGGRLQGRIKYALNEKAKPVVELLRDIARVKAESKKELVELAQKSLDRIDAITHPKTEE